MAFNEPPHPVRTVVGGPPHLTPDTLSSTVLHRLLPDDPAVIHARSASGQVQLVNARYRYQCHCQGGSKPMSTPCRESCKHSSHELVQARGTFRSPRLSPWQSERGLDPRGAGIDRAEGTRRLYLRGSGTVGWSESGSALPAFSRPRRTVGRRGAARLRSIRG